MKFQTINPTTEEPIKEYEIQPKEEVFQIASEIKDNSFVWKNLDISERAKVIRKIADALRIRKKAFAELMTTEMGKPIKQAYAEIEKCAWTAEVYSDNAEKWLADDILTADGKKHFVTFEPLGVVLSIMPWNFPFWQAFRFAIPAMIAGNATILKHSNVVAGCALAIEEVFREASMNNFFRTIITDHDITAELIKSHYVDAVSLTGSVPAGQKVASLAGQHLKKCVLELGGSDPFIILDDADVEKAAEIAVTARLINNGQSCIAAKRFIVVKSQEKAFTEKFVEFTKNMKVGNPMDENTDVGPLVNAKQMDEIESQLKDSVKAGAKILFGGKRLNRKGYFFEPAVVANVKTDMRIAKEEVFGPVAPIIVVKDEDEAIKVANNSEFGLGASIWTNDGQRALRVAKKIDAGCVFINSSVKSDPRVPFGGIKKSGIGRELSHYGLKEFVNVKAVNVY